MTVKVFKNECVCLYRGVQIVVVFVFIVVVVVDVMTTPGGKQVSVQQL